MTPGKKIVRTVWDSTRKNNLKETHFKKGTRLKLNGWLEESENTPRLFTTLPIYLAPDNEYVWREFIKTFYCIYGEAIQRVLFSKPPLALYQDNCFSLHKSYLQYFISYKQLSYENMRFILYSSGKISTIMA